MRACLVLLCLLAATLALSVSSNAINIYFLLAFFYIGLPDVVTEEDNKPQILPTVVPFEASSQEQEDEELSSEGNANTNKDNGSFEGKERIDKSSAVLLSEEELVDLLKKEAEEEQVGGRDLEEDVEEDKSNAESGQISEDGEASHKDEGDELETDGSTESDIPVDLDYAADSGILQPLQIFSAKLIPQPEDSQPPSQRDVPDIKEREVSEKELPITSQDYDQDVQNTDTMDTEEVSDQDNLHNGKNYKDSQDKSKETDQEVEHHEPKSSREHESGSRVDEGEEGKSKNDSGSHTKGKTRKQKKNQRARKHSPQRAETQTGQELDPQDSQEPDITSIDNTVHKGKRRRAGKWGPLVGMNPVQIRASVDLYPSSRHYVGGVLYFLLDPCDDFHCKRGKTCKLDADNKPGCVCQEPSACHPSVNEFDHVCGTDNKTYDTSCELFAAKCNLDGTKKGHRLHLDYTGPCKLIPPCLDTELVQFPLRMRDWLKNVLLQLYEHDSSTPGFLTPKQRFRVKKIFESERRLHAGDHSVELLAQDFEKNYNMYIYPVHWQFAQLDQHPSDRLLSHSELAPLRVPLVPMEHCTSRFFQECDADKDKQVSLKEWTSCFGIRNGENSNLSFIETYYGKYNKYKVTQKVVCVIIHNIIIL
uniref:SPARC-like protein 1 n=1 Tax=Echeneis naucrates TaxID=173247 RepID=A0A665TBA0_ECHNA